MDTRKLKIKWVRFWRRFWGVSSVSDYRKFLRKRYKDNPELEFEDNYNAENNL